MQSLHRKTQPRHSVSTRLPLDLKCINLMSYTRERRGESGAKRRVDSEDPGSASSGPRTCRCAFRLITWKIHCLIAPSRHSANSATGRNRSFPRSATGVPYRHPAGSSIIVVGCFGLPLDRIRSAALGSIRSEEMILPTKHLPPDRSLMGVGAAVLKLLSRPKTISQLWDDLRAQRTVAVPKSAIDYRWFVLSLDLLYIVGAVRFQRGLIVKESK